METLPPLEIPAAPDRCGHLFAVGALGWNRTSDTRFRKPVLYPLSYEGKSL